MKSPIYLLLAMLALGGCARELVAPGGELNDGPIPFQNISEAGGFVLLRPGTEVIRSPAFWRSFWASTWTRTDAQGVKTPPPEIDFERKMVIAVYWGEGYSGCGNAVEAIDAVIRQGAEIVVRIAMPDFGPCRQAIHPIQMIQIDQTDLPIGFVGEVP